MPPPGHAAAAELPADAHATASLAARPRDLPDGKTLLAALNLAHRRGDRRHGVEEVGYADDRPLPVRRGDHPRREEGLVSNEADGTVSVIDLAAGQETKEITVGPHLSHPRGHRDRPEEPSAYVAVTHQDLIAVIDTNTLEVERTLSVERPQGIGTAPVQ